jgi:pimeloyl-ACP methyl ester carboxylesterase
MNLRESYQEVALPQGTIRYHEQGDGPPLVFVHGLLVTGDLWRKVVPLLSTQFRCIVPDLPLGSHTAAMNANTDLTPLGLAQIVADFLAALDLHDVTLIGNDTGGAICQIVITEHPERITRLVLTNCDTLRNFLPPIVRPFQYGAHIPGFVFVVCQALGIPLIQHLVLRLLIKHTLPPAEVLRSFFEPSQKHADIRRDLAKVLKGISPRYTLTAARKFPDVQQPVLLAWATEDRWFFPPSDVQQLQALFPSIQVIKIADSYTFIPEDQPQLLADAIATFVHSTAAVTA